MARGLKYKALAKLLKVRHSVSMISEWPVRQWMQIQARTLAGERVISSQAGLAPFGEALRACASSGLGACALRSMLRTDFGVTVSSPHLLRTWLLADRRTAAGAALIKSHEALEAHAAALRAGLGRGLGAEALRKMLLEEHGVTVSSRRLLSTWMIEERRRKWASDAKLAPEMYEIESSDSGACCG